MSRRTLNPFAFPSGTKVRTLLLVFTILGLCLHVGHFFTLTLAARLQWPAFWTLPKPNMDFWQINGPGLPTAGRLANSAKTLNERIRGLTSLAEQNRVHRALDALATTCWKQISAVLPYILIPGASLLLVTGTIVTVYLFRVIRLRRLSLDAGPPSHGDPDIRQAAANLVAEARLFQHQLGGEPPPSPELLIVPGFRGGRAYGLPAHPVIGLNSSSKLLLRKDLQEHGRPYKFRALVLHELAHFVNRDVLQAYFAEASGIVLLPVALLLVVAFVLSWSIADMRPAFNEHPTLIPFQVAISLLFIEIIRRSLLRDREFYADLRISLFWRCAEQLRSVLSQPGPGLPHSILRSRLSSRWQKHPSSEERRRALDDPGLLFRLPKELLFLAGFAFGSLLVALLISGGILILIAQALCLLAAVGITRWLIAAIGMKSAILFYYYFLLPGGGFVLFLICFGLLVVGTYLMTGTLGIQVQRESVAQLVQGEAGWRGYWALLAPAFFVAAGIELGLLLEPLTPFLPGSRWGALGALLWPVFATLPIWSWMAAIRLLSCRLLGKHLGLQAPRRATRILSLWAAVLLWTVLISLLGSQFWISPRMTLVGGRGAFLYAATGFVLFVGLGGILLFVLGLYQALRRRMSPQACPHCGSLSLGGTVASTCQRCARSLAPWLVLEEEEVK
ncbi:MAG TPA: hypothetical protein VFE33_10420 [Thermoanaerobaculia bacterium]|nr:hypothetical protein [Thermoanaerobaculia bacterium]